MQIAIEFGGGEFRSLRREGGRLLARRVPTEYVVVSSLEAQRRLLERHGEGVAVCDEGLLVYGMAARELAELLSIPLQSVLDGGRLRQNDPVSRQLLGALVEGLLPPSPPAGSRGLVIAALSDDSAVEEHDLHFLNHLVKLRGYAPETISPSLGLIFGEGSDFGYSGIAIHLDHSSIDVSIVFQTRQVAAFTLPFGGARMDREIALSEKNYVRLQDGREALDARPLQEWREGVLTLNRIVDPRTLALRNQYRELAHLILYRVQQELTPRLLNQLPRRLPLILGGPLAKPAGLEHIFSQTLLNVELPLQISMLHRVTDFRFASLRGGLLLSELSQSSTLAAA
ncbi:hypothetical protein [Rubinisphaera margarita]|uniref:hypothetical protein n=1 Tax=Rubinisphaera margarita TaxID=2909586 RepID=UPI001EE8694C|nr:hypothetical protein [Rubinisphaera margarita]MCG6157386.1 hypothetical protein [Rubinisphaera margarita]